MIGLVGTTVHTTGINWDGVLANVAAITIVFAAVGAVITKSVKRSVGDQVSGAITDQVVPRLEKISGQLSDHDRRIARLEGVEEGKRQAIAAAGVTTT